MPTVDQIFSQFHLIPWWKQIITQAFGQNGEEGEDYGLGSMGRPVGSITSGKIVYVGDGGYHGSSIGQIVQVVDSSGALIHYQHLKTSSVRVGQVVGVGDILGTGGGCPVGAYYDDTSRNDCKWYDSNSTGQHIEVRYASKYNPAAGVWSQGWINPQNMFNSIGSGQAGSVGNPSGGGSSGGTPSGGGGTLAPLNLPWGSWGDKIGIFLLALVLVAFGVYLLFQKQVDSTISQGAHKAVDVGKVAVLA